LAVAACLSYSLDRAFRILVSLNFNYYRLTLVNNQTSTASTPANRLTMPGVVIGAITKPVIGYLVHIVIVTAGFGAGEPEVIEMYLC
jgi:hypothetical protein